MEQNANGGASVFSVSKQKWKFILLLVLLANQVILFALMIWSSQEPGNVVLDSPRIKDIHLGLLNVFHGCILLPWLAFALRCPACKKAIVWYIMRKREQRDFVPLFVQSLHVGCPACNVTYASLENVPTQTTQPPQQQPTNKNPTAIQ